MPHPLTKVKNFDYGVLDKELVPPKADKNIVVSVEEIMKAYEGDFWQDGTGSLFPNAVGRNSTMITAAIKKRFVFRNVIKEVVSRVSGAFFSKPPNWSFMIDDKPVQDKPPESGQAEPDLNKEETDGQYTILEKALGAWWTENKVVQVLIEAFESRLVAERGAIRIYIPSKFKEAPQVDPDASDAEKAKALSEAFVKLADIPAALDAIKVEYVKPTNAKLLKDGGHYMSLARYAVRINWESNETENVIEFTFVDDDNLTFMGIVQEKGGTRVGGTTIESVPLSDGLDLGGRPLLNEFQGKPYVTQALYKLNQLLNLALTCAGFSTVDNGFGEVFLTNVELETEKIPDPLGSGELVEVPKKMARGGGTVQSLVGIKEVTNEETGQETRATPGVHFREPSQMTSFKDCKDMSYQACLEESTQLFAQISGDAAASGESRVQAMTDFWLRIQPNKPEVDTMGSWLMTTVTLLAGILCGKPLPKGFTVMFDSRVFIGALSADEQRLVVEKWKAGLISIDTCRVLLGIDDPALEAEKVQDEYSKDLFNTNIGTFQAKANLFLTLQGILPDEYLYKLLGITDPEEIKKITELIATESASKAASLTDGGGAPFGG